MLLDAIREFYNKLFVVIIYICWQSNITINITKMRIPVIEILLYTFTKVFGEGEFHEWIDLAIKCNIDTQCCFSFILRISQ